MHHIKIATKKIQTVFPPNKPKVQDPNIILDLPKNEILQRFSHTIV